MKKYPLGHRILHWAIALLFTLILFTIFLRMTWMNANGMAEKIYAFGNENDLNFTQEQAKKLAKQIRLVMFQWHFYLGYALTAILLIKFYYLRFQKNFILNPFKKGMPRDYKIKFLSYIIFYVAVTITIVSGLLLHHFPSTKQYLIFIHKSSIYILIPFTILHIVGVVKGENTKTKGITSKMI